MRKGYAHAGMQLHCSMVLAIPWYRWARRGSRQRLFTLDRMKTIPDRNASLNRRAIAAPRKKRRRYIVCAHARPDIFVGGALGAFARKDAVLAAGIARD